MTKSINRLFCLLLFAFVFSSCNQEDMENPVFPDGETTEITFSTSIPGVAVNTRAMTDDDENILSHVDVLVFLVNNGAEKFAYRTHGTPSGEGTKNQYLKATMLKSENGELYTVAILANLRNEVDAVLDGLDPNDVWLKDDLLREITFRQNGRWPVNNDLGFRALPMWGESTKPTMISKNTMPSDFMADKGPIPLQRSVARIQVGISIPKGGTVSDGTDFFAFPV